MKQCDVPAELVLERRHFEALDIEHVNLLAAADVEPHCLARNVGGYWVACVAERLFQERCGARDVAGRQRQMREAHGAYGTTKPSFVTICVRPPGAHREAVEGVAPTTARI